MAAKENILVEKKTLKTGQELHPFKTTKCFKSSLCGFVSGDKMFCHEADRLLSFPDPRVPCTWQAFLTRSALARGLG